jgi:hypothetical protein
MTNDTTVHEPVAGDVIPRSTAKMVGGIAFTAIIFVAALFIIWAYFTGFELGLPSASVQVNWLGAFLAFVGVVLAPLIILGLGFMLLTNRRIVLGSDRLQVLQRLGGADKVTTQIPYRNIANLACDTDEGARFLGIDLVNVDDGETFATDSNFAREKSTYGWHFRVFGGYQKDVRTIHDMLARRLQDYRHTQQT